MFTNIGGKIKVLAKVVCFVGFVITLIVAITNFVLAAQVHSGVLVVLGILFLILGAVLSWVSSFFIYGFGEITSKVTSLDEKIDTLETELKQKNAALEALLTAKNEKQAE